MVFTAEQRATFDDLGVVRLPGAFTAEEAEAMRHAVWAELATRHGVDRDDPSTWEPTHPTGLKNSKRHKAFAPIGGPALGAALDDLLGEGRWDLPKQWGQVMVTFPEPGVEWRLPHTIWHPDFGFVGEVDRPFAVDVFAFFGEVVPRGGGTLVIARSHRLVAAFTEGRSLEQLADYTASRDSFMAGHPWLKALVTADDDPDRAASFMERDTDIGGVDTRVVELTGQPGDIVVTHPWVFHCRSPNVSTGPRFMRVKGIYRRA